MGSLDLHRNDSTASSKDASPTVPHVYVVVSETEPPPSNAVSLPRDRLRAQHTSFSRSIRSSSTSHLDGLRGLAAIAVFIQHLVGYYDLNVHEHGFGENGNYYFTSLPFIRLIFSGGSAAVTIFFVLSGYVLAKSPLMKLRDGKKATLTTSLISSFIRRPLRLYLPVLAVTGMTAFLLQFPTILPGIFWAVTRSSVAQQMSDWCLVTVKYLWPFQDHKPVYPYSPVIWTIPEEYKGSMLIYFCIWVFSWVTRWQAAEIVLPVLFAVTVVCLLAFGNWASACFIAGMAVCYWDVLRHEEAHTLPLSFTTGLPANFERPTLLCWSLSRSSKYRDYAILTLSLYLLSQPAQSGDPVYSSESPGYKTLHRFIPSSYSDGDYYRYWHSYGSILLLWSLLSLDAMSPVRRFLSSRPLIYLGRISFMLYLVHLPIFGILSGRVAAMFGHVPFGAEPSFWNDRLRIPDFGPAGFSSRFVASVAVLLPVCVGIAELGTRYVDSPSIAVGKRLVRMLGLEVGKAADLPVDAR